MIPRRAVRLEDLVAVAGADDARWIWEDAVVDSDGTRWDKRYAAHELATPTPPEALRTSGGLDASVPTAGRALDIACGAGAQTLWLADRGLDVVALDVSPTAIELTTAAAARSDHPGVVDARVHDFDQGLPAGLGVFDVVVCQRFRDPALYGPIIEALGPRGIGIVTVLSAVGLDGEAGAFQATPGELQAAFSTGSTEVLGDQEESGVASIVFRRLPAGSGGSAV